MGITSSEVSLFTYLARCGHRNGSGFAQMLHGCTRSESLANHQLWLALKWSELQPEWESEYIE